MQLKFTLPALAALALSSAPLASADSGGFAASCRDVKIFQRGNWEMSAICRRSDGSEHYTELNLDLAIHNGGGNLAWGPHANGNFFKESINDYDTRGFRWVAAPTRVGADNRNIHFGHWQWSELNLNDHISNRNGNLNY